MDSRQLIAMIMKNGWVLINARGRHYQFRHPQKPGRVTVPHPKRDLPKGTVHSILKQAGLQLPHIVSFIQQKKGSNT